MGSILARSLQSQQRFGGVGGTLCDYLIGSRCDCFSGCLCTFAWSGVVRLGWFRAKGAQLHCKGNVFEFFDSLSLVLLDDFTGVNLVANSEITSADLDESKWVARLF